MAISNVIRSAAAHCGFVTRKGAMYYAEKAGKKFADKAKELNKVLDTNDVVEVINESLPKRLRPEVLSKREDMIACYERSGLNRDYAEFLSKDIRFAGFCVPNGTKKRPLYFDKSYDVGQYSGVFAHELEHALEFNNRLSQFMEIKFWPVILKVKNLFDKNFRNRIGQIGFKSLCLQSELIEKRYLHSNNVDIPNIVLKYCDGKGLYTSVKKNLKYYKKMLQVEIPAYTTGGNVQNYADKAHFSEQSDIAKFYKKVINFIDKSLSKSDKQLKNDVLEAKKLDVADNSVTTPSTIANILSDAIENSKYEHISLDLY